MKSAAAKFCVICWVLTGCVSGRSPGSSPSASEDGWRHTKLRSTDGTNISIDFRNQYYPPAGSGGQLSGDLATPVWVNMTQTNFNGFEPVIVTFKRYCHRLGSTNSWTGCGDEQIRLRWEANEHKYTGNAEALIILSADSIQTCMAYEVSFFIGTSGGRNLGDPVKGSTNFRLDLATKDIAERCQH